MHLKEVQSATNAQYSHWRQSTTTHRYGRHPCSKSQCGPRPSAAAGPRSPRCSGPCQPPRQRQPTLVLAASPEQNSTSQALFVPVSLHPPRASSGLLLHYGVIVARVHNSRLCGSAFWTPQPDFCHAGNAKLGEARGRGSGWRWLGEGIRTHLARNGLSLVSIACTIFSPLPQAHRTFPTVSAGIVRASELEFVCKGGESWIWIGLQKKQRKANWEEGQSQRARGSLSPPIFRQRARHMWGLPRIMTPT